MQQTIRDVQERILEIMKFIDSLCRENDIEYYIMGGTALGAVRHGGFIPWDDDLDIFMTPSSYRRFKRVFEEYNSERFVLQEWRTTPDYLEYAKVRMNGTTFIEENFKGHKDMHQGIYVDIMILHKCPDRKMIQKSLYFKCKYVTLYGLQQRGWKPKNKMQAAALRLLKCMPNRQLVRRFYRSIYKYDDKDLERYKYFYWITPAKFKNGLFDAAFFSEPVDVPFEDTVLLGSKKIESYLEYRYGDYRKLPPEAARQAAVHAILFDVNRDYSTYFE